MPMYKCEEPGCGKFFSNKAKLNRHIARMHAATPDDNPEPEDNPAGDTLMIKKPAEPASSYHCNDCGTAIQKGEEVCPGCGQRLVWEGVE
jgi:rubrerythrin